MSGGRTVPAAPGLRPWRLLGITLAVSAVGVVGGAAWAAPDQLLPVAKLAGASIAARSTMLTADAGQWLASFGGAQGALDLLLGDRSPRRLGMLIAGITVLAFGVAALRSWYLARRRAATPVRLPRSAASPIPAVPARRRGSQSAVPQRVRALAAQGSSPIEIARHTGLPMDAIALLLAVTETGTPLPSSGNRNRN
jgi:hypothetical protein